jgi:hypothetical protein
MAIRIERNEQGNCINFHGSSNPTYWNACLSGEVDASETDTVNVVNDIITATTGVKEYEFFQIPYTEFVASDGNAFASAQAAADYITANANVVGLGGGGTQLNNIDVCFKLDDTSTSIMLDNGYSFGVNTIKAVNTGDGLITINSKLGDITHFTGIDHTRVCDGDGSAITGGLNDVINYLNELFTVGAFEQVVISDPYSTMIADVGGVSAGYSLVGSTAIDPVGDDIFTNSSSGNYAGLLSTQTIDQAGEYFTFDIRGEGQIGFGLVHTQDSYDDGYYSGNATYANPTTFATSNSAHYGFQFSHWFHPTPNGSWTNYGANTSYSQREHWGNNWDKQQDWLDGENVKVKVGIDANGFIEIATLNDDSTWGVHARTSYPVADGAEFKLGIKTSNSSARVSSAPKAHLLEPEAPTMYFRWIESPDDTFVYPLFATAEEAEYYDEITNGLTAGTGSSHTHTYADDPTNTTWYMPEATHDASTYHHTSAPDGTETFDSNTINWTTITSLTNADLTPTQFSNSNITQEEGTSVNMQLMPADATFSQSVTITPSGSGLVYNTSTHFLQGTLADVGADTVYTITVTRANSYGSSTGSFTITATDVAPVSTMVTPWTKALDFSGSNEHLKQASSSTTVTALRMYGSSVTVPANSDASKTASNSNSKPWATAVVFKADLNSSTQHIWNQGEGASSGNDNIYLKVDGQGQLQFNWGRVNAGSLNQCRVASGIQSNTWYGVYIAHKGTRLSGSDATASNLADAFDIRLMSSGDSFTTLGSNLSTSANWTSTGGRMDRSFTGDFTIGGRGSNRSFHGKVASMVICTLRADFDMPTESEIELMITDPKKWEDDYRDGELVRWTSSTSVTTYNPSNYNYGYGNTQIWLMGDGTNDSYSNGIRNQVHPTDASFTKLQLNSMVSNDIETVSINGLT